MEIFKGIIERFIKDICIDFGIDKFAVVYTKVGVIVDSPCVKKMSFI